MSDNNYTIDFPTHITDFATTAMRLSMTETQFNERDTLTGTDKIVDGLNLYDYEHHELIIHNVKPQYIPSWMSEEAFDYAVTDGEWKYMVGVSDASAQGHGWYHFPGYGVIDKETDYDTYSEGGGNCSHGCLFHITTDPFEWHDVSDVYGEIADYFSDLINAIYNGGFDESYHSGQPYEEDYRGWMADNILRPYLSDGAIDDYDGRVYSNSDTEYDYAASKRSWDSDYDGENNPFGTDVIFSDKVRGDGQHSALLHH